MCVQYSTVHLRSGISNLRVKLDRSQIQKDAISFCKLYRHLWFPTSFLQKKCFPAGYKVVEAKLHTYYLSQRCNRFLENNPSLISQNESKKYLLVTFNCLQISKCIGSPSSFSAASSFCINSEDLSERDFFVADRTLFGGVGRSSSSPASDG